MASILSICLIRCIKTAVIPLALVLCTHASWASDPSSAALRVLLGSVEPTQQANAAPASNASNRGQRRTITVMRGETLDRAIRRAVPGLPLHPDFLRQAFVNVNPQVFPKGSAHAMRPGTTLQIPTADELRFMLMSQYPESVNLFQLVDTSTSVEQSPQQAKRHWVRFP